MGIDEISYAKGHKYATLVYDLERSRVVWVGQGKARETIDAFFRDHLSASQKDRIRWACCDLSETFIGAIGRHCPNAELVLDRFHVVKALNEAVDEVRKEQWRQACGEDRKLLKGLRWVLLHHSAHHSPQDRDTLKALEKANRRIYRAWRLKDEFEHFWRYKARWAAERFLEVDDRGPAQPPGTLAQVRRHRAKARRRHHRLHRYAPDQRRRRRPQPRRAHAQEPRQWI